MTGDNQFGKTSECFLKAEYKDGKTILTDVHFTAPFKIMRPFPCRDGGIQVMLLCASAGILDGDRQKFRFEICPGAKVTFLSQSYDKIHPMEQGCAERESEICAAHDTQFIYNPQPVIPFRDSDFRNRMKVMLEDESSDFRLNEILTCGRAGYGNERFRYRRYHSLTEIVRGNSLIYRDNTRYEPRKFEMEGMGMFEGYTHLNNMFLSKRGSREENQDRISAICEMFCEREDAEGAATELSGGDIAVRAFAKRAQPLEEISREILAR